MKRSPSFEIRFLMSLLQLHGVSFLLSCFSKCSSDMPSVRVCLHDQYGGRLCVFRERHLASDEKWKDRCAFQSRGCRSAVGITWFEFHPKLSSSPRCWAVLMDRDVRTMIRGVWNRLLSKKSWDLDSTAVRFSTLSWAPFDKCLGSWWMSGRPLK